MVGIFLPKSATQNALVQRTDTTANTPSVPAKHQDGNAALTTYKQSKNTAPLSEKSEKSDILDAQASQTPSENGWQLSPNPANVEATIAYNFDTAETLKIDVFNATGQLLTNYILPDTQVGTLRLDISAWASGVYSLRLSRGATQEVKQLVVQK
ncbi:MAG: T9SS type A sorting domain-containing protein [Saprospiraceae bacterium]|nr:T9SS type A sorting domain-containing protein [Saprospiraceae bacterium]